MLAASHRGGHNVPSFVEVFGTQIPDVARSLVTPGLPQIRTGVAPEVIAFPVLFGGYAIDLIINNLDGVGTLTFRLNQRSGAVGTISPSGAFLANDQKIVLLEIVTGTNWEVAFSIVKLPGGK